jgi:hypothetical protein
MKIELVDVIRDLKKEIQNARAAAADEGALFVLGEVEIAVEVEQEKEVGGGLKFYLAEIKARGSQTNSTSIKLKLREYFPGQVIDSNQVIFKVTGDHKNPKGQVSIEKGDQPPFGKGKEV